MKKIVTIGGGTGNFTILTGLKKYPVDLTAVVSMFDDGGSTGVLRDELGVLPPGDVRQCLVALCDHSPIIRDFFTYRFEDGFLAGHSAGNIFLSAMEKITGSFDIAVKEAARILQVEGRVLPVTLERSQIIVTLSSGKKIFGEDRVFNTDLTNLKKYQLKPKVSVNPEVYEAILASHAVVIGPGDLYSSLLPHFYVDGMVDALRKTSAKKIFVCNLMTKQGHSDNFSVQDFVNFFASNGSRDLFNVIIYNNKAPDVEVLKKYARGGEQFVLYRTEEFRDNADYIGADLVSGDFPKRRKKDLLQRNLIRHNPDKLGKIIFDLI